MMKNLLNLIFLFLAPILLGAQVVSVSPPFPSQNDTVTIIFDASEGNGALSGFVPVYTHTGIITAAAGPGNWQNVQGNWGTADPNVIMTPLGNNKHSISYHIPTFYNIGTGTIVTELSFVFRNSNGNTVGRAADGSDIFYPIYPANSGLLAAFLSPNQTQITNLGSMLNFSGATNVDADIDIFDNGVLQSSVISSRSINTSFSAGAAGLHTVELVADDGSTIVRDTVYYVVNSAVQTLAVPANTEYGINYLSPSSLRLKLHAPFKNYVYVIGDFNNWEANPNYFMHKDPNGTDWWIDISNLSPGDRYSFQYWVDGDIKVADPYSELVLDPWNDDFIDAQTYPNPHPYPTGKTTGITSLIHMDKPTFNWQNSNFLPPNKDELIIYELHLRDFIANHNYQTLIDTLDYLERLGINAIELMPVNEFEGNESWGYNPSFHMALDKYYGTPEKLKEFVDTCHGRGIAVFLDVVLNHAFSQSPLVQLYWDPSAGSFGEPTAQNPWMNTSPKHDFNVGYDFNHESQASQDFAERIMKYWVSEYKVDGYRMDLSKGFTQNNTLGNVAAWGVYDQSRINILTRLKNQMESAQPNSYMILEHFAANNEELELSNKGFMIWGNMHYNYNEAAMGYISNSDFSGAFHSQRGWTNKHLIAYQESHDEERITFSLLNYGNSSGSYNTQSLATALARKELTSLFLYTIPGPKMLWQFGELGYDIGINDPCRICNKPLLWSYQQDANRARLYTVVSNILNLRTSYPVFNTNNYRYSLNGTTKRINLDDPAMNATVIGNFDVIAQDVNPNFQNSGLWYEFFSGDSINVNNTNALINLQAGEYRLYTTQKVVVDNSIGIGTNPLFSNGFTSYPNPADNTLYIDFTEAALRDKVKLNIFNITGQKVLELENAKIIQERRSYNISSLKPGTYLIRLETSKTLKQDRLIVE
jgi:1,4-alpha-glucan branching enzyme